jgi:glycosyltransferase involved in cell wall biosynthesis
VPLPSISIVTACLNAAETIEGALESVRAQDYPGLEHVVVDGGSTDGTLDAVRAAGLPFISEPDRGRADAVNKGVRLTSGDVVGFLNADDRYAPGALRAVGEAFGAHPEAGWATGYCRIVDGAGVEIRKPVTAYKNWLLRHWSFDLYVTQNFVSDPSTFVRRSALLAAGELDHRYRISHDYDLWLRVARQGPPIVLERNLADFRMTEGTMSIDDFGRQFREHAHAARRQAGDRPLPLAVNALMSRAIVLVYKGLRTARRLRSV